MSNRLSYNSVLTRLEELRLLLEICEKVVSAKDRDRIIKWAYYVYQIFKKSDISNIYYST